MFAPLGRARVAALCRPLRRDLVARGRWSSSRGVALTRTETNLQDGVSGTARPPSKDILGPEDLHHVFACEGIDGQAMTMRRRVQVGMALEFLATQAKIVYYSPVEGMDTFMTTFIENSNAVVALHIFVVWRYAAFLRDALLARHVTRVAIVRSDSNAPSEASEALARPCEVLVETGPWVRRLRLVPAAQSSPDATSEGGRPHFKTLLAAGVLHLDRQAGSATDEAGLECMLSGRLAVEGEDITMDVHAAEQACVPQDRLASFLPDDSAQLRQLTDTPSLTPLLQCRGGPILEGFGWLALAMGLGSVGYCIPWR